MSIKSLIKSIVPKGLFSSFRVGRKKSMAFNIRNTSSDVRQIYDLLLASQTKQLQQLHPNPLNSFGRKCFSQTDEDGITIEILKRINCLGVGNYAEFGVGDGTENNTLILKSLGWHGFWVGGEELAFEIKQPNQTFSYLKDWITLENIVDLARRGIEAIGAKKIDVISLDLDGNDIYFVEELLSSQILPKLFIVEYNAKFPPPVRWAIDYNPEHLWRGDDYFGASLTSFNDLFEAHGYRLVCCNSHTGSNAFFVRVEFSEAFTDIPTDISDIYSAPRYYPYHAFGHKNSIKTIEQLFS